MSVRLPGAAAATAWTKGSSRAAYGDSVGNEGGRSCQSQKPEGNNAAAKVGQGAVLQPHWCIV